MPMSSPRVSPHPRAVGISALELLDVVERADRMTSLEGWSQVFSEGLTRTTGARACQLLRVREGGDRLESLGPPANVAEDVLAAGHSSLGPDQRRRIYQSGATVVCLDDVYGPSGPRPPALEEALRRAEISDVIGLVAAPGVSVGLFVGAPQPLDLRRRQLLLALAHHVGASVALRAALARDARFSETLPARLQVALEELDRRRRWARRHGDADDAASALRFLAALSAEGFAVVHDQRAGRRQRLVAVRVKDPSGRAMRALDAGEREVLEGLARGCSLKEIAYDLGIAEATVSGRIARIRSKLGIDPRSAVVRVAGARARRD